MCRIALRFSNVAASELVEFVSVRVQFPIAIKHPRRVKLFDYIKMLEH
jgi:hypothetical protein